jgi:hypothetical protein
MFVEAKLKATSGSRKFNVVPWQSHEFRYRLYFTGRDQSVFNPIEQISMAFFSFQLSKKKKKKEG